VLIVPGRFGDVGRLLTSVTRLTGRDELVILIG